MATELVISAEDQDFINGWLKENNQTALFQAWATVYTNDTAKERIVIITSFRIVTIKCGAFGRSVRQNFPILDLECLTEDEKDQKPKVTISMASDEISIVGKDVPQMIRTIAFAFLSISHGLPADLRPKFDLPSLKDFRPPVLDNQEGLLASYIAQCDYTRSPCLMSAVDLFLSSFESKDRTCDLGACLSESFNTLDLQALAAALKYNQWFREFVCSRCSLGDTGLTALSNALSPSSQFSKIVINRVEAGRAGFSTFGRKIGLTKSCVKVLDLSFNLLEDAGLEAVVAGLQSSNTQLESFVAMNCGITASGLKAVAKDTNWVASLQILNMNDNKLGKEGTARLVPLLNRAQNLSQLHVARCEISTEDLLKSLLDAQNQGSTSLSSLNISGNVLTTSAQETLQTVIGNGVISRLSVCKSGIDSSRIQSLLESILANKRCKRFNIDLGQNDLGPDGAKQIAALFSGKPRHNIAGLGLSGNGLEIDGIKVLCESLAGSSIGSLNLDSNMRVNKEINDVGSVFAKFVQNTPALEELSVAGSPTHNYGINIIPFIKSLHANSTLQRLDISGNEIGEKGLSEFALVVKTSKMEWFNIDNNGITLKSFVELQGATQSSRAIVGFAFPFTDIRCLYKKADANDVKQLDGAISDMMTSIERNQASRKEMPASRGASRSVVSARTVTIMQEINMVSSIKSPELSMVSSSMADESKSDQLREDSMRDAVSVSRSEDKRDDDAKGPKIARKPGQSEYEDYRKRAYLYDQLKTGAELPPDVNPAKRELYLADDKFFDTFQMHKIEFKKLPKWRQIALKKSKNLI